MLPNLITNETPNIKSCKHIGHAELRSSPTDGFLDKHITALS